MQLPVAFRSFLRPSSAPSAKAFSHCSYSLDLFCIIYHDVVNDNLYLALARFLSHGQFTSYANNMKGHVCLVEMFNDLFKHFLNDLLYSHHAENHCIL